MSGITYIWNNTSICCGTAGVLQFVINLALVADELPQDAASIKKDSSDVAKISGNILLGESYVDGERVTWPVAFERVKPEIVTDDDIFASGTNVFAALKLAQRLGPGKTVVTVLPDTAERYFSTPLFTTR